MELNIFYLFLEAGMTIKAVILLLLALSLYSWWIIFQKLLSYRRVRRETTAFVELFWKSKDLAEAHKTAKEAGALPAAMAFRAAYQELQRLKKFQGGETRLENRQAGMELLRRTVHKNLAGEIAQLGRSLPFLASTGSASPFIGLFGTVWGIMTSFHEIGQRGSASLAVVAPGVSEALVVTAIGLAVAIPAVVFYNFCSNQLADLEGHAQAFATDFINLIERDFLARQAGNPKT